MKTGKMHAGVSFPALHATGIGGETVDIGKPGPDADWRIVFVYRGKHCPMCTRYLNKLEDTVEPLAEIDILLSGLQFIKDPGNDYAIRGTYRS